MGTAFQISNVPNFALHIRMCNFPFMPGFFPNNLNSVGLDSVNGISRISCNNSVNCVYK